MANISIQNIVKEYGNFRALDDVSVEIADGEMFFLLGASGCGKTTLLRSIAGFEQPTSGRILIDGKDVTSSAPYQRPTGMVFQGYALWPHKTVQENVSFGLEMQKVPKAKRLDRVRQVLEQVQISDLAHRRPGELSGGQQQRVALARTLVTKPKCLLLDEPLANLDAKLRRDMRLEIRRICKDSGLTAIYVTHDREEALSMADRIAVMYQGKIMQLGTPREVYRNPANAFIAGFIGETNIIPGKILDSNTVATPLGNLVVANLNSYGIGEEVDLSIRPEAISMNEWSGANKIEVISKYVDYLGEIADHVAETTSCGTTLKFSELNPRNEYSPDQRLNVFVRPDDIAVMPKRQA